MRDRLESWPMSIGGRWRDQWLSCSTREHLPAMWHKTRACRGWLNDLTCHAAADAHMANPVQAESEREAWYGAKPQPQLVDDGRNAENIAAPGHRNCQRGYCVHQVELEELRNGGTSAGSSQKDSSTHKKEEKKLKNKIVISIYSTSWNS